MMIGEKDHLCYKCKHCDKARMETTIDTNDCTLFTLAEYKKEPVEQLAWSESGNDRIYSNGIVTVDNGGGYWIIRCPYFHKTE